MMDSGFVDYAKRGGSRLLGGMPPVVHDDVAVSYPLCSAGNRILI